MSENAWRIRRVVSKRYAVLWALIFGIPIGIGSLAWAMGPSATVRNPTVVWVFLAAFLLFWKLAVAIRKLRVR